MDLLSQKVTETVNYTIMLLKTEPVAKFMEKFHELLAVIGVPPPYVGPGELLIAVMSGIGTLVGYYFLLGRFVLKP